MKITLIGSTSENNTGPSRVTEGLSSALTNKVDLTTITFGDDTGIGTYVGEIPDSVMGFYNLYNKINREIPQNSLVHSLQRYPYKTDIRTVQWCMRSWKEVKYMDFPKVTYLLGDGLLNAWDSLKMSGTVVATSPLVATDMKTQMIQTPDTILPLGTSSEYHTLTEYSGDIVVAGRWNRLKNQSSYAGACSTSTTFVGSHPERVPEMYKNHSFTGFLPEKEYHQRLQQADLVIVPSRDEKFSLTGLEAISHGCGLIITDSCGFAQFGDVRTSPATKVVPNAEQAAVVVENITQKEIESMKQATRDLLEKFTWENVSEMYISLYEEIENR